MTLYYWIQLYKAPTELAASAIVQRTVDALIGSGCVYQFSQITTIEDDSLPWEQQKATWSDLDIDLGTAIRYTINDLETWRTTNRARQWLPGMKLFFEFDFQFDEELLGKLDPETAKRAKQVGLDFWVEDDQLFGERIVIDLDTWEEYVLMYGDDMTHDRNKEQILSIVENVCRHITPHYGWLDGECNSLDEQYDFTNPDNWSVRNEFAVLGPQIDKVPRRNLEVVSVLENGCVLLKSSLPPLVAS